VPRRLVYVVNRRTVVDQATDETVQYRNRLLHPHEGVQRPELAEACAALASRLRGMTTFPNNPGYPPIAISTLRGQFADNGEWRSDPARPAVVVGTIDMVGSRLLFTGYGLGYKTHPLHAGFLGYDALLVHDEAHLSKPFDDLVKAVAREQAAELIRAGRSRGRSLKIMSLTATPRDERESTFALTAADYENPVVRQRLDARKGIKFWAVQPAEKKGSRKTVDPVVAKLIEIALGYRDSGQQAILVYVVSPEQVNAIYDGLTRGGIPGTKIETLTGTIRGFERDRLAGFERDGLARSSSVFARFQPWRPANREPGTVYLLSTSAGELGADISGDHLACDLTTFESMGQRFGRVNRRGDGDALIDVVHEAVFDGAIERHVRRQRTLDLLHQLPLRDDGRHDASPGALGRLPADQRLAAFSVPPFIVPVTDILFDAWSLTTVGKERTAKGKRKEFPGRPPVEPYLRGISPEIELPQTTVAWRADVSLLDRATQNADSPLTVDDLNELLASFRMKPQEELTDQARRVGQQIGNLAKSFPGWRAIVISPDGSAEWFALVDIAADSDLLEHATVILPAEVGGLRAGGTLGEGELNSRPDVADELDAQNRLLRVRMVVRHVGEGAWQATPLVPVEGPELVVEGMQANTAAELVAALRRGDRGRNLTVVGQVTLARTEEASTEDEKPSDEAPPADTLYYLTVPRQTDPELAEKQTGEPQSLDCHQADAGQLAEWMAEGLDLEPEERAALVIGSRGHDSGKNRDRWQNAAGRRPGDPVLAKPLRRMNPNLLAHYRHEFGSLVDIESDEMFANQPAEVRDLILHMIATHHGRGRPYFPAKEAFDPNAAMQRWGLVSQCVARRYAQLQRRYGRWGLAWLESLLRAVDALASGPNQAGGSE
jgi:CRISPR-associated endonuclease/helicase Cas3